MRGRGQQSRRWSRAVGCWWSVSPYTGLGEPESRGYLSVQMGALVKILPGTETAGGEGNIYPSYAFGELLGEGIRALPGEGIQRGWIPLAVLAVDA